MGLFITNLKRILRKKTNIMFMIIIPVVLITFVMASGNFEGEIRCGVVDNDKTRFSQDMIQNLKKRNNIEIIGEDEIKKKLVDQTINCAVLIGKGFTSGLIEGKDVKIRSFSIQETNLSAPFIVNVESYLNAAQNIAVSAGGDVEKFYTGMGYYNSGNITAHYEIVRNRERSVSQTSAGLGFLVMNMLFLSSLSAMIMIRDKQSKTLFRTFSAPVTVKKYMLANIASFFTISVVQITLIFLFMIYVVKADMGASTADLYSLTLVFSLVCVSMAVAINTVSRDLRQSGLFLTMLLSPMCMLAGCWWPRSLMPEVLQKIADFVPPTWIMKAYDKVLRGGGLASVLNEVLIMLAFSLIFFLLASWRKTDIAE